MNKSELSAHVATQTAVTKGHRGQRRRRGLRRDRRSAGARREGLHPRLRELHHQDTSDPPGPQPRTGERIAIAASTTPSFKAAPRLKRHRSPHLLQAATVHQHPPTPTDEALSDRRPSTYSRRSDLLTPPISKQRAADATAPGTCTSKTASTLTGGSKNRRSTNPPQPLCHRVRRTL